MANKLAAFTLIEVLIALMIFAIIGMTAMYGLQTIIDNYEAVKQDDQQLAQLQLALTYLQQDFSHVIARPIRLNNQKLIPAFVSSQRGLAVEFSRSGWQNPHAQFQRSQLLRVGYRLQGQYLQRLVWLHLDRNANQSALARNLLNHVSNLHFYYYDSQGKRLATWPEQPSWDYQLPHAVEIDFNWQGFGAVRRVIAIAASQISF